MKLYDLPQDIFADILKHLSLRESRILYAILFNYAKYKQEKSSLREHLYEIKKRQSPISYLSPYFPDAKKLLVDMLKNNAIISGSRAAGFFEPQCFTDDSDWDFYIANNTEKVKRFKDSLQSNGVIWLDAATVLANLINSAQDTIAIPYMLFKAVKNIDNSKLNKYLQDAVSIMEKLIEDEEFIAVNDSAIIIPKQDGSPRLATLVHRQYVNDLIVDIEEGVLNYRGKSTKFQLVVSSSSCNPLESLLNFHTTLVQCFISGTIACHMYADSIYSKSGRLWKLQKTKYEKLKVSESINKYINRGFSFNKTPMYSEAVYEQDEIKRTIGDGNTDLISIKLGNFDEYKSSHTHITKYARLKDIEMRNFSWSEYSTHLSTCNTNKVYARIYASAVENIVIRSISDICSDVHTPSALIDNAHSFIELPNNIRNSVYKLLIGDITDNMNFHV